MTSNKGKSVENNRTQSGSREVAEPLQDRVVKVSRVSKVVKGGRRFSFSALVVVGDRKNKVGYGVGKANEVPDAIKKASEQAKKNMIVVEHIGGTLPFEVEGRSGASRVRMYPATEGKGIIAGGAVRLLSELSGLKDVVCKIHGSKNAHNVVRAVLDGYSQMSTIDEYADRLGVNKENLEYQPVERKNALEDTDPVPTASGE